MGELRVNCIRQEFYHGEGGWEGKELKIGLRTGELVALSENNRFNFRVSIKFFKLVFSTYKFISIVCTLCARFRLYISKRIFI